MFAFRKRLSTLPAFVSPKSYLISVIYIYQLWQTMNNLLNLIKFSSDIRIKYDEFYKRVTLTESSGNSSMT